MTTEERAAFFTSLTDLDIAKAGLEASGTYFMNQALKGRTRGYNLHGRAGMSTVNNGQDLPELAERGIGSYMPFTDFSAGKFTSLVQFGCDTAQVAMENPGGFDESDPKGWQGGHHRVGRVRVGGVWITRRFGLSNSGDWSHADEAAAVVGVAAMIDLWASRERALAGELKFLDDDGSELGNTESAIAVDANKFCV